MAAERIIVREVNSSDFYRIAQHYSEFYDEIKEDASFGLDFPDENPGLLDEMVVFVEELKACAEGNAIGLIAENDGVVEGLVGRKRPKTPVSHRGDVYLSVKKEFRGEGVGTVLLKEMIQRCKGKFEILELEAFADNQPARHL
jgi:GNAT superfamily N-acetyltransferase